MCQKQACDGKRKRHVRFNSGLGKKLYIIHSYTTSFGIESVAMFRSGVQREVSLSCRIGGCALLGLLDLYAAFYPWHLIPNLGRKILDSRKVTHFSVKKQKKKLYQKDFLNLKNHI